MMKQNTIVEKAPTVVEAPVITLGEYLANSKTVRTFNRYIAAGFIAWVAGEGKRGARLGVDTWEQLFVAYTEKKIS
jgi:hypothetical protein